MRKVYYSIYHPILLMTSRPCLFHQVTGCGRNAFDGFMIDLREVANENYTGLDKARIVELFENSIGGDLDAKELLKQLIGVSTGLIVSVPK